MLKQYFEWKGKYPDCLLFFRMGDFYEMFFEDARTASGILDIVLTARDNEKKIPMAGVPHHAVETYLERLVAAGKKVAICEQISTPDGKNLVERQVVRVVTPGTFLPGDSPSEGHLAAISKNTDRVSVALLNCATGLLRAGTVSPEAALSELAGFSPGEIIIPAGSEAGLEGILSDLRGFILSKRPRENFNPIDSSRRISREWGLGTLSGLGLSDADPACGCAGVLLSYIEETQFRSTRGVIDLRPIVEMSSMVIDQAAIESLEVAGHSGTSLFDTLDRCRTLMGRRRLKDWLLHPLLDPLEIAERQEKVASLISAPLARAKLKESLSACGDLDRALSRLGFGNAGPKDAGVVRDTLKNLPLIREQLKEAGIRGLLKMSAELSSLADCLSSALSEQLPKTVHAGEIVGDGFDAEIDELRNIRKNENDWLEAFLDSRKKETGIKNMKIGFNKVFGYYLEVGRSSADSLPPAYVRKQTLVSGERFITEELKYFEERMLTASEKLKEREEVIFREICRSILDCTSQLRKAAIEISEIDVLLSFAQTASVNRYCRPEVDLGESIKIEAARHPVVELSLPSAAFTPNDIRMDGDECRISLITGPNMAGKSTYLRTAALLVIMAQAGSFIPARSAKIGVIEKMFCRIGARDEIARGRSTFMVEMVETANILNNVSSRSLVILDEVGRGTSTYDGMSIAWAVLEFLHHSDGKRPKVLFATHFHELTALSETLHGVKNLSMAVEEKPNGIIFLYKVIPAPASRSYGIEVAKIAGIPEVVIRRSMEILERFEKKEASFQPLQDGTFQPAQLPLFGGSLVDIVMEVSEMSPDGMTPLEAIEKLYQLKEKAGKALNNS